MRYEIMTADVLNQNGRIYPLSVVKTIASKINEYSVPVTLGSDFEISLDHVLGMAKNAEIVNGVLSVEISILETPMGVVYDRLVDEGVDLRLTVAGIGNLTDRVIHDYNLSHLFIHTGDNA